MSNAQNGARIKAWAGPNVGGGIVKNITFDGFIESKVDNPLIIDQVCLSLDRPDRIIYYFPIVLHDKRHSLCSIPIKYVYTGHLVQPVSGHMSRVLPLTNSDSISGTGTKAVVAALSCSPDGRCNNINVNNINLA